MSLEATMQKTNSLLEQLLAKFDHVGAAVAQPAGKTATSAAATAEQPAKPAAPQAPAAQASAAAQTTSAPTATALNYEKDVKPLALKLVNAPAKAAGQPTGRDRMVETLKKYSVRLASEIPADKLPGFVKDVQAELAALGVK